MKKFFSVLLTFAFIISAVSFQVTAADITGKCGDDITYTLTDDGTLTISGTGDMYGYNLQYPTPFTSYSISKVIIENGITSIGKWAFRECTGIKSVIIPSSVTSIGEEAFSGCTALEKISIPSSIENVGLYAFHNCDSLVYNEYDNGMYLGNEVEPYIILVGSIESYFETFNIHTSTKIIYENALQYSGDLVSVTIPDGVRSIGDGAFESCSALDDIIIPNSVTYIGYRAFRDCGFGKVTIHPDTSLNYVDMEAFSDCNNLGFNTYENAKYLGDENSPFVVLIGAQADNITSCTVHNDTKLLAYGAFAFCESLKTVTMPTLNCAIKSIPTTAFCGCISLESINIPSSVTEIYPAAFAGCILLKNVAIPSGVTYIGEEAFGECESIKNINIPNSVKCIEKSVFDSCSSLESITIPSGVKSIGKYAFKNCTALKTVTIPADSLLESIDSNAFYNCEMLESIVLPNGMKSVGMWAFENCRSLKSVTIPSSVTNIGGSAFQNCHSELYVRCYKNSYAEEYATTNSIKVAYINAPEPLGGQIKQTAPAGLRFGFSLENFTKTPESLYVLVKKTDGEWKKVNITKYYDTEKTIFTLCITNIPDSAKDTLITAKAVAVFADGTEEEGYEVSLSYNKVADAINNAS